MGRVWSRGRPPTVYLFYILAVFSQLLCPSVSGGIALRVAGPILKPGINTAWTDTIEIVGHSRSYVSGPIDGQFTLTEHDTIELYAGKLPSSKLNDTITVRRWALYGDGITEKTLCTLHVVYDYGERVVFVCNGPGTYMAYVDEDSVESSYFENATTKPKIEGTADKPLRVWIGRDAVAIFDLTEALAKLKGGKPFDAFKSSLRIIPKKNSGPAGMVQSDPIEIISSQYCYYWNYQLREIARVGYFFRESDNTVGTARGSSYILLEMEIWIMEPNAVGESERESYKSTTPNVHISSYSKILTRKFNAKGLYPCLRYVHPSVEISSDITFFEHTEELNSPHWKVEVKVHTDTIISTLSDVGWTISSRQHIALYHCFVGDIRVFVDIQNFQFIHQGLSDRSAISWNVSALPDTMLEYLNHKIKHVYGHPTAYIGPIQSRNYQPSHLRTDMVVINNPCVAQEFALAAAGQIYIVEEFLTEFSKNSHEIILPGFENLDADTGVNKSGNNAADEVENVARRHQEYLKIADAVFTPTHAAFLMEDSSMYLHSRSAYYKGLAYLTSPKKVRLSALVKRRWCARSGTPKTNNMMIPAFSPLGNIVIIQVYPVEGTTPMWMNDPSPSCLVKSALFFSKTDNQVRQTINESCIHQGEAVSRSDERGLKEILRFTGCHDTLPINTSYLEKVDPETLKSFLMNQGKIYSGADPHFSEDLTHAAIYKTVDDNTHYNKAFMLHVDSTEEEPKIPQILLKNGLNLKEGHVTLHSVDFTPDENIFLVAAQFYAKEFVLENATHSEDLRTIMITTMFLRNMPSELFPEAVDIEEKLDVGISFPGLILVRKKLHKLTNKFNISNNADAPYVTRLFPLNTAIPSYVIDLGNVFIFSTVETKYARPLTFFTRDYIHTRLANVKWAQADNHEPQKEETTLKESDRKPKFERATAKMASLFDVIVTEHGTLSILKRRRMRNRDIQGEQQTIYIGTVVTQDALREVSPFAPYDRIFQMGTPDGEIVYGKFTTQYLYPACDPEWKTNYTLANKTCLLQPSTPDYLGPKPFCVSSTKPEENCTAWMYTHDKTYNQHHYNDTPGGWSYIIGQCDEKRMPVEVACMITVKKSALDSKLPPDNSPNSEIRTAEILSVPYHSLLNGNLQLVDEEKRTGTGLVSVGRKANENDRKLCPFITFHVDYVKFNFAEVGFKTRITAEISYRGQDHVSEAELIIEYENIPGVQVEINSAEELSYDQTSLTKTIDLTFRLSNINLNRMRNQKLTTHAKERRNLAKEKIAIFGITIRPAIVSIKCRKEEFYINLHFSTGCNPFNKMRFISESSPVKRHEVKQPSDPGYKEHVGFKWKGDGDSLLVHPDDVWHKQRAAFKCEKGDDEGKEHHCEIPYAYLYKDNIYDISWRDPFVPKFEQFLRTHSRKVTANVVLYDLFGFDVVMNISNLDAGCFHTAGSWYNTLLNSTKRITLDTSEQEDVYSYYVDCFDHSILPRDKPKILSFSEYRLLNTTNYNRIRFDVADASNNFRRTKNRNQFLLFRATVINTEFNRFTYCQLMDTFFLVRIVGMQAPRKGLDALTYGSIVLGLIIFLAIVYLIFAYCYTWKLDVALLDTNPDEELLDEDNDDLEERRFARDVREQRRWKTAYTKIQAVGGFKKQTQNADKPKTTEEKNKPSTTKDKKP